MMTRNADTAKLADDLIGAAQALDVQVKALKLAALAIRREGMTFHERPADVLTSQREWKALAIKNAAVKALQALGAFGPDDNLTEYRAADHPAWKDVVADMARRTAERER